MTIFDHYRQRYEAAKDEELSLQEFLNLCRDDRSAYVNAAERLLMAIGEPEMIDTALDPRLSRLFSNRVVSRYKTFEDFYGMEDAIEQIVSYLKHAAQGLEERKQILYLLGPVGGGKSSLAEKLKSDSTYVVGISIIFWKLFTLILLFSNFFDEVDLSLL